MTSLPPEKVCSMIFGRGIIFNNNEKIDINAVRFLNDLSNMKLCRILRLTKAADCNIIF